LLLMDYLFQRNDYKRMLFEKMPFIVFSVIFGLIAIEAQSEVTPNAHPFKHHFFLITYAISFYVAKFFVPIHQSPLFKFPDKINDLLPTIYYVSALIIPIALSCIYFFKAIRRELIFAILFFGCTIGLLLLKFPIGPAYLAERYTYLPYLGVAFLCSHLLFKLKDKSYFKLILIGIGFWVIFLIAKTFMYNKVWFNSESLWRYTISQNPRAELAYNNLGLALIEDERPEEALNYLNIAIAINPYYASPLINRALAKYKLGSYQQAIFDLNNAIRLDSISEFAFFNRGNTYFEMGEDLLALDDFNKATQLNPNMAKFYNKRGLTYSYMGMSDEAFADYFRALELDKTGAEVYNNIGFEYTILDKHEEAISYFNTALKIKPEFEEALMNRGSALFFTGKPNDACRDWKKALDLGFEQAVEILNKHCK